MSAPLRNEFRPAAAGFGNLLRPYIALLVVFFLVMLLLGAVVTGTTPGGALVAVGTTAALFGLLWLKFRRAADRTTIRFSPAGVELIDGAGYQVRLSWADITRVDSVLTRTVSPRMAGVGGGIRVGAGATNSLGLVGWGERIVPPRIPGWQREQLAAVPHHPTDGRPEVAIPLGAIDPSWIQGEMGAWVRMHRPDLLS